MRTNISGMVRNLCRELKYGEDPDEALSWLTKDDGRPMTRWGAVSEGLRLLDKGYRFLPLSDPDNTPHE